MKENLVDGIMREIVAESCGLHVFTPNKYRAKYEARHPDVARLLAEREALRWQQLQNPEKRSTRVPEASEWKASFQLCAVWPYVAFRYGCDDSAAIEVVKKSRVEVVVVSLRGHSIRVEGCKRTLKNILSRMTCEEETNIEKENEY